jgi:hypothetical protein
MGKEERQYRFPKQISLHTEYSSPQAAVELGRMLLRNLSVGTNNRKSDITATDLAHENTPT